MSRMIVVTALLAGYWLGGFGFTEVAAAGEGACTVEGRRHVVSDVAYGDWFGSPVAISGDVFVVGATGNDEVAEGAGAAYVFRFDGNSWIEEQKLTASDGAMWDSFGSSVSVDGDVVVVGAPLHDAGAWGIGTAYVFRYRDSTWTEEGKLLAIDGAYDDGFGVRVSVSGDVVVVGDVSVWAGDPSSLLRRGGVYVFRYNNGVWIGEQELTASGGAWSSFGPAVCVDGDSIVVGAPWDDSVAEDGGATYTFAISSANCGDYDGDGVVGLDDFKARVACAALSDGAGNADACNGAFDSDNDGDIDLKDFAWFSRLLSP